MKSRSGVRFGHWYQLIPDGTIRWLWFWLCMANEAAKMAPSPLVTKSSPSSGCGAKKKREKYKGRLLRKKENINRKAKEQQRAFLRAVLFCPSRASPQCFSQAPGASRSQHRPSTSCTWGVTHERALSPAGLFGGKTLVVNYAGSKIGLRNYVRITSNWT